MKLQWKICLLETHCGASNRIYLILSYDKEVFFGPIEVLSAAYVIKRLGGFSNALLLIVRTSEVIHDTHTKVVYCSYSLIRQTNLWQLQWVCAKMCMEFKWVEKIWSLCSCGSWVKVRKADVRKREPSAVKIGAIYSAPTNVRTTPFFLNFSKTN